MSNEKEWRNYVSENTVQKTYRALVELALEQGTKNVSVAYADLAKIIGMASNSVYKAINVLIDDGKIEKIEQPARRFSNVYQLKTDIDLVKPISKYASAGTVFGLLEELKKELEELKKENEKLRRLVNLKNKNKIISETKISPDSVMVVFQSDKLLFTEDHGE